MQSCYDVLEVAPEAPQEEIHAQYRALVFLYHPDRYKTAPERVRGIAEKKMLAINDAFHVLSASWKGRPMGERPLGAGVSSPVPAAAAPPATPAVTVSVPVAPVRSGRRRWVALMAFTLLAGAASAWGLVAHFAAMAEPPVVVPPPPPPHVAVHARAPHVFHDVAPLLARVGRSTVVLHPVRFHHPLH